MDGPLLLQVSRALLVPGLQGGCQRGVRGGPPGPERQAGPAAAGGGPAGAGAAALRARPGERSRAEQRAGSNTLDGPAPQPTPE